MNTEEKLKIAVEAFKFIESSMEGPIPHKYIAALGKAVYTLSQINPERTMTNISVDYAIKKGYNVPRYILEMEFYCEENRCVNKE